MIRLYIHLKSTHGSSGKQHVAERLCELEKEEGEGEDEVEYVVRVEKLSQLPLGLLCELKGFPEVRHTEVWHDKGIL